MGLQIRRAPHVRVRIITTLFAAFALIAQPLVALNLPAVFAVGAQPSVTPASQTVYGGQDTSSSVVGTGFKDMKVTFHYNAQRLDADETFVFGITGDASTEQTVTGKSYNNPTEESDAEITVPASHNDSNFQVYFKNNGNNVQTSGNNDQVNVTDIAASGTVIPTPTYSIVSSLPASVEKGVQVSYTISTTTTDTTTPQVKMSASDGGAHATYEYQDSANNWHSFDPSATPFGPFPLTDGGVTNLRATYSTAGTFTQSLTLKKLDGTQLATTSRSLEVTEPAQSPTMQLCSTINTVNVSDMGNWADDSKSGGQSVLTPNGLHVYTTDTDTANNKAAKYLYGGTAGFDLKDAGAPDIEFGSGATGTLPSLQLTVDDGHGTWKGNLVYEPSSYGEGNWWSSKDFGIGDKAHTGYVSSGTLQDFLDANPTTKVLAVGYSLGSGVTGDAVIKSLTAGCVKYVFASIPTDTTAPAVPTLFRPADNTVIRGSDAILKWNSVTDPSGPVTYNYESSLGGSTNASNNSFTNALYGPVSTGSATQIDARGSANNTYYWHVQACDAASNCSNWSEPWEVTIDSTPPTLSDFQIDNQAAAYSTQVKVSAEAADNYQLKNVVFYVTQPESTNTDGTPKCTGNGAHVSEKIVTSATNGHYEATLDTSGLNGEYCVSAQAADQATNHSAVVGRQLVAIDNIPPTFNLTDDGNPRTPITGGVLNPDKLGDKDNNGDTIRFTKESASDVLYVNGTKINTSGYVGGTSGQIGWKFTQNATYTLYTKDQAGNQSTAITFTVDRKNPEVGVNAPSGLTNTNTVEVKGWATDENLRYYACYITTNQPIHAFGIDWLTGQEPKNNGNSLADRACNTSYTTSVGSSQAPVVLGHFDISGLPDGTYMIHVHAHDSASNTSEATTTFTIDRTAPDSPTVLLGAVKSGKQTVTVDPANANVTFTYDNGVAVDSNLIAQVGGVYTVDTSAMQKGTKITVSATSTDAAGNTSKAGKTVITVENGDLSPLVTIAQPTLGRGGNYTISGTSTAVGKTVTVTLTNVDGTQSFSPTTDANGTWSFSTPLRAATQYVITASTTDQYGYGGNAKSVAYSVPAVKAATVANPNAPLFHQFATATSPVNVNSAPKKGSEAILGAQDTKSSDKGVLGDTAALTPSSQGWKIFGFAWYWWLLLIAAVVALWWFLAARRRSSDTI